MRLANDILTQTLLILKKSHLPFLQRILLLNAFLKVRLVRFLTEQIFSRPITHISFLGYKLKVDTAGSFYGTFLEVFVKEDYFFTEISQGSVIIDAGANIGLASIYLSWRFPGQEIHAYEAHPETFQLLKRNVAENKLVNVHIHQAALCDHKGTMVMTGELRAATVDTEMYTYDKDSGRSYEVTATTLSSECRNIGAQQFVLKMDIEGSEYSVLKELASTRMLKKFTAIRFEYHAIPGEPNRYKELIQLLGQNGMRVKQVSFERDDHFIIEALA